MDLLRKTALESAAFDKGLRERGYVVKQRGPGMRESEGMSR